MGLVVLVVSGIALAVAGCSQAALAPPHIQEPAPGSHAHLSAKVKAYLGSIDPAAYDTEYASVSELSAVSDLFRPSQDSAEQVLRITWHDETSRTGLISLLNAYIREHYGDYGLKIMEDGTFVFADDTNQDTLVAIMRKFDGGQPVNGGGDCSEVYENTYYRCYAKW